VDAEKSPKGLIRALASRVILSAVKVMEGLSQSQPQSSSTSHLAAAMAFAEF
jgi:hypothetical protein